NVLRLLQSWGYNDPSLMAAALLHDVGKSRFPFSIWDRTLVVLVRAVMPDRARAWGSAERMGWRRPFVVSYQHPRWSADMAAGAGADPLAVALIADHQMKLDHAPVTPTEKLLSALQQADNLN
ncbi:MAG TPA: HD domain-containing protein, partial [Aggregatilineales bacterium]|nr:HD domain-containing protein [Aggregatilineales bacterium]